MKQVLPRALYPGDTVAIIAPASSPEREKIERAIMRLEERGLQVKTYGDLYRRWGYLAGDDETRAEELMQAVTDSEVAAVFPARGGTGITRLLDLLDYSLFRRHPKIIAGFSDITALHAAIGQHARLVTFHAPHPNDGLGAPDGLTDLSARTFWRAVWAESYADHKQTGYELPLTDEERARVDILAPGKAQGRLVGGNLALVCAILGTPYEFDMMGGILLIEDVGELPYRIDRFLAQLRLAGKLETLSGVILGQFTDCEPAEGKPSLTLNEVFDHYFSNLGIPVLENFPIGHTRDNATVPLGVEVELDADEKRLTILENPVRLAKKAKA